MIPRITRTGAYHPVDLANYLNEARKEGKNDVQVSRELNITLDRAIYAMNEGFPHLMRRADIIRLGLVS